MDYYNKIAPSYNELHGEEQLEKMRLALLNLPSLGDTSKTIIDVGCGTGLAAKVFRGKITGVEPATELAKQASFRVYNAKAESLPFPDKKFDIAVCFTAIHNFKSPGKAIKEMKRVSREFVVISILKKSRSYAGIKRLILQEFKNVKEIKSSLDDIFICSVSFNSKA